ncbi:MAG: glycosyltransferase family 4 protein [Verrucomicrobiaceae bacterium]|nr:glycosyltransferase family 4 protein [Verrucomicrobiaceae bacterium]
MPAPSPLPSHPARRPWRILHSESSRGWGGQEHRVMAELRGFQERGHEVFLVAHPESQVLRRAQDFGMGVVPCLFDRKRLPLDALQLAFWLRRNRIDIVNTHSSRDGWLLGIAARLARTPLLIRSRHIDVEYPHPSISKHAFTTFADHVLTTSDRITSHFRRIFPIAAEDITTLPTGIDTDRFTLEGPRASLPVQPGTPVVGMVSVLRYWKGHDTFFRAIHLLRQKREAIQFVVVGGGDVPVYQQIAIRDGAGPAVSFLGHREDIPEVLRALDVLCIPSKAHEGVPQIGLQALACQTAVVGSDCGGIPEIIRDGETGRIFPAGDHEAFAARILETLEEKAETDRLRQAGRRMVEEHHSIDVMLNKLEALYRRCLPA